MFIIYNYRNVFIIIRKQVSNKSKILGEVDCICVMQWVCDLESFKFNFEL